MIFKKQVYEKNKMKYFLDTEFIEQPGSIQLISIGIKCEDNREYYAVSSEFNPNDANQWVKDNVLTKINAKEAKTIPLIKEELLQFVKGENIEFYGYYADYDWVIFCWIFGTMLELPKGFPMYCRDLKQMLDERNLDSEWKKKNCPDPEDEHNALADANWNYNLFKKIL